MPIKSAVKEASKTNLVLFIFTLEEYTAIVYKVVSVAPMMTEAIIPSWLSTPQFFIISVAMAIELLPEIGRSKARGTI